LSNAEEFLPLSDAAARAVSGPNSRHTALIEDAFRVLIETPGGGVSVRGDQRGRAGARKAIERVAALVEAGGDVSEADVRVAIGAARSGEANPKTSLPAGRRGAVSPKTAAQARYLDMLQSHELVFGVGPAGTGRPFSRSPTARAC
jgi:phosphate starvation-inducible PhoH-like protein